MSTDASTFEFNWRYAGFEIRTTHGLRSNEPYVELVKHDTDRNGRDYVFTLAYWHIDDEGAELRFVGDRPFEYIAEIDINKIWKQMWLAGEMMNDWYKKEHWA